MTTATALKRHHEHHEVREPLDFTFFHIVWIFMLASFVGLVGEVLVSFVIDGRWESRVGFVIGPLSPLYGVGAILMTLALNPIRGRSPFLQFLVAGLVGGILEYTVGWFLESAYGIVAWSYANHAINFHGHTSTTMMAIWGLIGIAWATWGLPVAVRIIEHIPPSARKKLTAITFVFIIGDSALTLACLDSWFLRSAGYPICNPIQEFCATYFGDEFMRARFETMSMWTSLAGR